MTNTQPDEVNQDRYVGNTDLTHWYTPLGRWLVRLVARVSGWLGPNAALIVTLVGGAALVLALAFLASRVYDAVTEADGVAGLDKPILAYAMGLRSPALDQVVTW